MRKDREYPLLSDLHIETRVRREFWRYVRRAAARRLARVLAALGRLRA